MSYTVLNSAWSSTLLSDPEVAGLFSADADLAAMLDFEAALAEAEAEAGVFSTGLAQQIIAACREFRPDMGRLHAGISRDGMAVPDLIRQLREAIGTEASKYLHFGATSQDVIDTSLTLRLQQVNQIFAPRLSNVCASLAHLDQRFGPRQMMARTRMQSALPILVSHRIDRWRTPLLDLSDDFGQVQSAVQALQFGGPVGTLDQLGAKAPEVRGLLAERLGLLDPRTAWHTDRSRVLNYSFWLTKLATALGKIGLDIMLMAQDERSEIALAKSGGSSAMAHKKNPIKAEVLLALARFISTLHAGLQQCALHEQERSGTNWTLEWMLLPQICIATGTALITAQALLKSVDSLGER